MNPSVRAAARSTPVQTGLDYGSIELHCDGASLSFDLGGAIRLALSRAAISQKAAALTMDIDPSHWSRQLAGADHVWLDRLLLLPETFWAQFLPIIAEPFGYAVENQDRDRVLVAKALESLSMLVRRLDPIRLPDQAGERQR